MKFKEIPLAEIVDVYVDNRGKTCPVVEKENSYKVLIATNCITESLYPEKNKIRYVDKETYENWFRSHPQPNDIIFVNKGTPGGTALVPENIDFCIAQDMVALRIKDDFDFKYVFAALRSDLVKKRIESMHVGTMIPHFKKGDFKLLTLPIPEEIKDQENIGKTHLNILKKIHVNKEIINKLEELAQTLFKRWFVDFEFPNEEGKPYKSSGGKMVQSELGMIPEGWEVSRLGDIMNQIGNAIEIKNIPKTPYIGLADMPRATIALSSWKSSEEASSNKTTFKKGNILFGKLRPYFKKVGIAPIDGICSTDIIVLNSKEKNYYSYLLSVLTSDNFIEYCSATATGTRMPRTGWRQMSDFKIIKPTLEVSSNFNSVILPLYDKVLNHVNENTSLSTLRDVLLPKLLSGEIELPDDMEVTDDVPVS